jgi:hypothetical protein
MSMISLPAVGVYRFSRSSILIGLLIFFCALALESAYPTTKELSQIVTPDLQPVGNLSPSFQKKSRIRISSRLRLGLQDGLKLRYFREFSQPRRSLAANLLCSKKHQWLLIRMF